MTRQQAHNKAARLTNSYPDDIAGDWQELVNAMQACARAALTKVPR